LFFLEQFGNQVAMAVDNARLFEAVKERNRKIEALDRRKNEMITILAHEFRTPMNVVQSSADILVSGMLNDQESMNKVNDTLRHGIDRLTRLLQQVRNVSLLTSGDVKMRAERISIVSLFDRVMKEFMPAAIQRSLRMDAQIGMGADVVSGDFALVLIVLKNLISNAIRFTADGGKISLTAKKQAGMIEFTVSDSGIGIDADSLNLLFEKFFEVGDVLQHSSGDLEFKSRGLGLGLATVKSILASHGADIEVKSEEGKGSTFSFCLLAGE
jgi:signal transduction histidine kinase